MAQRPVLRDDGVMDRMPWAEEQAAIQAAFEAELRRLHAEGRTVYDQQIDPADTSTNIPELWRIIDVATGKVLAERLSTNEADAYLAARPDWVHVWGVHDEIQDDIREG